MDEPKPVDNGLPFSENAVFKLLQGGCVKLNKREEVEFISESYHKNYPVYHSLKLLINTVNEGVRRLVNNWLFTDGIKIDVLEPGKHLQSGIIKCHLVWEFIPDEPELTEPESPLDDIRKQINNQ